MVAALIGLTLECYTLVYQHYPGVDDPKKPILNRVLLVGGAVCLLSLLPDLWRSHWQPTLTLFFAIERAVTTLGAMLMALVLGANMFMPVLMPPNIMRHVRITLAYLTSITIGYFGMAGLGQLRQLTQKTERMGINSKLVVVPHGRLRSVLLSVDRHAYAARPDRTRAGSKLRGRSGGARNKLGRR
jgi:hypothetical protein